MQIERLIPMSLAGFAVVFASLGCGSSNSNRTAESTLPPRATWASDESYVSLTGTVIETGPDAFVLDYGTGQITVEMDDWDWIPEGESMLVNDDVVVYGRVDDDFYEYRKIEAAAVYVRDLGTMFYASSADEESLANVTIVTEQGPQIELKGTVESVRGSEFTLASGDTKVDVETRSMHYDPLDDEGYQRVRVGDRVWVSGALEDPLFGERDLMAEMVVSLHTGQSSQSETSRASTTESRDGASEPQAPATTH